MVRKVKGEVLDAWLPVILRAANERKPIYIRPGGDHREINADTRLEAALEDVISGGPGMRGTEARWLPRTGLRVEAGKIVEVAEAPPPAWSDWREHEEAFLAIVGALAADPRGRRLRRCDQKECRIFFVAKADHRRKHSFCSDEHRRAWDVAHRDPKAMREYMRSYRRTKARQTRARRRRA